MQFSIKNSMRNTSVKLFCLNLDQWFRRCCLKDFLSRSLEVLLFSGANNLCNFIRGHYREHSCEIILNLDQYFRRSCRLKKKVYVNKQQTHNGHTPITIAHLSRRHTIGITHVFLCINICLVLRKLFEHEAKRPSIQTSPEGPGKC